MISSHCHDPALNIGCYFFITSVSTWYFFSAIELSIFNILHLTVIVIFTSLHKCYLHNVKGNLCRRKVNTLFHLSFDLLSNTELLFSKYKNFGITSVYFGTSPLEEGYFCSSTRLLAPRGALERPPFFLPFLPAINADLSNTHSQQINLNYYVITKQCQ